MPILMVVNNPDKWRLSIPGVEVVAARRYLTDPFFHRMPNTRVFNLCTSYSYQSLGYYVSLLAEARDQRPEPDITTIQDMKSTALARGIAEDLQDLIQRTLRPVPHESFTLSIYFGITVAQRDQELGRRLFGCFRSPLLRAQFIRRKEVWHLQSIRPIPQSEIPDSHHDLVVSAAKGYFARRYHSGRTGQPARYDLAILHDPAEAEPPSDMAALRKFMRAAQRASLGTELITRDDFAHISEFDALFIRTTTFMNHYTYRFSRRAATEGMAVIDDPLSIARCTNKVYLAELMILHRIPTPRTVILQRDNLESAVEQLGLPLVLKKPDGAFSRGVIKVSDAQALKREVDDLLEDSEVIVAQAFIPTEFDWRVGVLDGQPLFVCKYFMAPHHWQIAKWDGSGKTEFGKTETLPVSEAPQQVVNTAVRAARLIGDGLYGVDVKLINNKAYVMEVNDNPNIDSNTEDRILKDELYDRLVASFVRRIERIKEGANGRARIAEAGAV
jgi:glutathione synthase/RimK-type ligase-like ATP-grasp enzyme